LVQVAPALPSSAALLDQAWLLVFYKTLLLGSNGGVFGKDRLIQTRAADRQAANLLSLFVLQQRVQCRNSKLEQGIRLNFLIWDKRQDLGDGRENNPKNWRFDKAHFYNCGGAVLL
tara:strand:- start:637 stop:984 length:348 start_codon:yes stop_codon:yes gene_type:complete